MNGSFDIIYSALCCYKAIHGNVKVPYRYVIAERDEAFPKESWGMKLGIKLNNFRGGYYKEHKQKLIELGVVTNANAKPVEFDMMYNALTAYKAVHGDLKITSNYQIAMGDDAYPEETWGMKLGKKLSDIRLQDTFKEHKQQLIDLGVDYSLLIAKPAEFDLLYIALSSYKTVYGDVNVPCNYVIAEDDEAYPEETWGMKLGENLRDVRYKGTFKEHKQKLVELGVEFAINSKKVEFNVLFTALSSYKAVHGDVKVPRDYFIVEDDAAYPEETWGMKLGKKLSDIRLQDTFKEHKQQLIDLGVDYTIHTIMKPVEFDVLYGALTVYKTIHGDVKVPYNYVIAEGDKVYPKETWGMKLGQKLTRVGQVETFKQHKHMLMELGVDYNSSSVVSANKKSRTG